MPDEQARVAVLDLLDLLDVLPPKDAESGAGRPTAVVRARQAMNALLAAVD